MTTRRFWARPALVVVRCDGLVLAVGDDVHLVRRNLVLLVKISLPASARSARAFRCTPCRRRYRCVLRFEKAALRVGLDARDHLIELGFGIVGQRGLAEREVAFVFAEDDFNMIALGGLAATSAFPAAVAVLLA